MERPSKHKRAAGSEDMSSHKKTRFLEPDEDPANFADNVAESLEDHPSHRRKGQVKNEGYDSDSTDDGEGVVLSRRNDAEDEEEDMFAVGDDAPEQSAAAGAEKKEASYLKLGDIEGQEFARSEDDSEDDGEPEDEDDAERRKKAGMGFELSSFNMREEMEEGKFTEDGSYIRSFDPHGIHDRWMEGLDDTAIKQARRNHRRREKEEQAKLQAEEDAVQEGGGLAGLQKELLASLKKGETVVEALQRLGKISGKKQKQGRKQTAMDTGDASDEPRRQKAQAEVDKITHLASTSMSMGNIEIYSQTYEELVRAVRAAAIVDENWQPPSADVQYEYKWDVPDASGAPGQTFGPYSEDDMQRWFSANYFGPIGEKIKVREVRGEWESWSHHFP
ncbi:hypothetical protein BDV98DRAFT_599764 [Pterulicium gracile]|uniref:GYF domain-containing protein n=1 Tax=Pterulicium gracile TaxID=1884261 RepID=A0A5C3QZL3_9AGAR|nr:hypothetical protein BDV98DRAFT_599764 [Pterula gracilis]